MVAVPSLTPVTVTVVPLIVAVATSVSLEVTDKVPSLGVVTVKVKGTFRGVEPEVAESVKVGVALVVDTAHVVEPLK